MRVFDDESSLTLFIYLALKGGVRFTPIILTEGRKITREKVAKKSHHLHTTGHKSTWTSI